MVAPIYLEDTYIDSKLSNNLDSTFAFEGPEKLLEIWFFESAKDVPDSSKSLRAIPIEQWVKILDLVNCKILSRKTSKLVDAYLLSESSLFVFDHKIILKTCGTTTTLACLGELFRTVGTYVLGNKHDEVRVPRVFYSRRSFMFPEKQKFVHRDWKNEVKLLDKYFVKGKSYVVGDFNSDDHWYLYMGGDQSSEEADHGNNDQTFEILMTELDSNLSKIFHTERKPGDIPEAELENLEGGSLGHQLGRETMVQAQLDLIFEDDKKNESSHLPSPGDSEIDFEGDSYGYHGLGKDSDEKSDLIHDAFSFTPCGYSSNSISRKSDFYYTLHITPEDGWSYASFETNYRFGKNSPVSISSVLMSILKIFKPGKFSLTLMTESGDGDDNMVIHELSSNAGDLKSLGYEKQERVLYDLKKGYKLLYLNFSALNTPSVSA